MTVQELRESFVWNAKLYLGVKEGSDKHMEILDLYNSYKPHPRGYAMTPTDSWCAAYVSAIAILSEFEDIMPIECSCYYYKCIAQDMGISISADNALDLNLDKGDIVLYNWHNGGALQDHIGIIESINGGILKVIEGNKDNAVGYREISMYDNRIDSYVTPLFGKLVYPESTEKWDYENIGWNKDDVGWWYAYGHHQGEYHKNNAYRIDNELFFFDTEGYCVIPETIECDNRGAMRYIHGKRVQ